MHVVQLNADAGIPLLGTKGASIHLRATAEAFVARYEEWKATGTTAFPGDAGAVARLSRRERTRDLAAVFDEVTGG